MRVFVGGRSDAALARAGRYGDGWTGLWVSVRRFKEAGEKIADAALAAGRDPSAIEMGLQCWVGVGDDADVARALLGSRMEDFYRRPFESFERYAPSGRPRGDRRVPGAVRRGRRATPAHHPGDLDHDAVLESAIAVREAVREVCG